MRALVNDYGVPLFFWRYIFKRWKRTGLWCFKKMHHLKVYDVLGLSNWKVWIFIAWEIVSCYAINLLEKNQTVIGLFRYSVLNQQIFRIFCKFLSTFCEKKWAQLSGSVRTIRTIVAASKVLCVLQCTPFFCIENH